MDRLLSLKVFIKIAETGSFTKTGEILGLPKASVSAYVQNLEEEIGTRLFSRTTRKVTLTSDGEIFLNKSIDLISDLDDLENLFKKDHGDLSGKIRIDMPIGFSKSIFMPNLKSFLEKNPKLEIELSTTDRRVDVITEGFDLVLRVGPLHDSSLIVKKIGELKIINVASREYVKKYGNPKNIDELKKHKLVFYSTNLNSHREGFEYYDGEKYRTIKMQGNLVVNNSETYLKACLIGLGIIQIPLIGVGELLKSGDLVEILPKIKAEPMTVSLLYPHRKNLSRRTQIFIDWMIEILKS